MTVSVSILVFVAIHILVVYSSDVGLPVLVSLPIRLLAARVPNRFTSASFVYLAISYTLP